MIASLANGVSGDNARKVVAMDLEKGFGQRQMGHPVKEVSLVYLRKEKDAKYGTTIVNQYLVLRLICYKYPLILYDLNFFYVSRKYSNKYQSFDFR